MGSRILSLIDARNRTRASGARKLKPAELSRLVTDDENPDLIRNLVTRGKTDPSAGVKAETLLRIARFFGVTPTFLRTGKDDLDEFNNRSVAPFPVGVGQPVISVTGGMGGGGLAEETTVSIGGISYQADDVRGEVILPDFMLASLSHSARRDGVHWFDVAGDSMEPTLRGGDWIGVNIEDKRIGQGGIFALRDHNGTIVVKRLEYSDQPGRIDIISDNPRQHSKTELMGDITVIGRVIARLTRVG